MGEQVGKAIAGKLYYCKKSENDRIRTSNEISVGGRVELFADLARLNTLYMIARAGSGHIGSSFSSLDIVTWLHLEELRDNDLYFSSKGHDAPGLYAVLIGLGRLPFQKLHGLRRLTGLPGHPDVSVPGMVVNSGSLGQGISKAKGIIKADRLCGRKRHVFVMTGDGELQEGQIWESLVSATNDRLDEITVIVDHNKLQSDYTVANTSDLGDLPAKFSSFGWYVERVNGHNFTALSEAFRRCRSQIGKPQVLVADTVKGCGVSFMEHTAMESDTAMYRFHSGAPDETSYQDAVDELVNRINGRLNVTGTPLLELEIEERPKRPVATEAERLIPAYSEAIVSAAARNEKIVVLDADLALDTGLIPFRDAYPDRFVECGIAEQDMVSQAGGLALQGYLPIVHSFACFLGSRANEQIYTNATERTKIIYVGSLAGVLPGGPGHSHQSVRDFASMAGMPEITIIEPSCAAEIGPLLDHILDDSHGSAYLRLVSTPISISYTIPNNYKVQPGQGWRVSDGDSPNLTVISYGPVMLSQAMHASRIIGDGGGPLPRIIALPWINRIDVEWLTENLQDTQTIVTIDNHYVDCGQGVMIAAAIAQLGLRKVPKVRTIGLTEIPVSGNNKEVLLFHQFDATSLAKKISSAARISS